MGPARTSAPSARARRRRMIISAAWLSNPQGAAASGMHRLFVCPCWNDSAFGNKLHLPGSFFRGSFLLSPEESVMRFLAAVLLVALAGNVGCGKKGSHDPGEAKEALR